MESPYPKLVLASSSPYRREILTRLGFSFEAISPDIDEARLPDESATDLVKRLAIAKATAVAKTQKEGLVIGSDQVCELGETVLGKPKDHADAVEQLLNASGRQAMLYSGLAVVDVETEKTLSDVVPVRVIYRDLQKDEVERYLIADQPYQCCGSLKVEGLGISLLSSIESNDPNAITGMPVISLLNMLRQFGATLP